MKKALLDGIEVQSIIIADDDFEHPEYALVDVTNRRVRPQDQYSASDDKFISPELSIDAPETIPNDGTQLEVSISTTALASHPMTVRIDGFEIEASVKPDESYIETVATSKPAGETISVTVESATAIDDSTEIDVVTS
jgi:hypothetical protein